MDSSRSTSEQFTPDYCGNVMQAELPGSSTAQIPLRRKAGDAQAESHDAKRRELTLPQKRQEVQHMCEHAREQIEEQLIEVEYRARFLASPPESPNTHPEVVASMVKENLLYAQALATLSTSGIARWRSYKAQLEATADKARSIQSRAKADVDKIQSSLAEAEDDMAHITSVTQAMLSHAARDEDAAAQVRTTLDMMTSCAAALAGVVAQANAVRDMVLSRAEEAKDAAAESQAAMIQCQATIDTLESSVARMKLVTG